MCCASHGPNLAFESGGTEQIVVGVRQQSLRGKIVAESGKRDPLRGGGDTGDQSLEVGERRGARRGDIEQQVTHDGQQAITASGAALGQVRDDHIRAAEVGEGAVGGAGIAHAVEGDGKLTARGGVQGTFRAKNAVLAQDDGIVSDDAL